ncbi:hypothetical protein COO60DRAFT_583074 [Scenedesmus sp. NREL 46B-D3]|nr:hypothetical protein COO60DRAFT_583074 [Scenedesmus sp. NREL 46B-D3]
MHAPSSTRLSPRHYHLSPDPCPARHLPLPHDAIRRYAKGYFPKGGASSSATAAAPAAAAAGPEPLMLKVKDWPPGQDFRGELPRHMMDFVERLPLRAYTDPRLGRGPLNLATMLLPATTRRTWGPRATSRTAGALPWSPPAAIPAALECGVVCCGVLLICECQAHLRLPHPLCCMGL